MQILISVYIYYVQQVGEMAAISEFTSLGPVTSITIKKSGAWISAQLTILCSINRKLRSGDYKEIGVGFLCSV